ncbi:MAG: cation-transporting P-type ATPase [Arthrospira sp. PLM2.Bin9]|nr:cation-transporting P-type ATPase [Arthrospira sp. PLM2.Bin9]TVU53532.1 MAG: cation-transporting P-type ATPase [Arthrospira sp. PLM2.Bin9]
MNDPKSLPPKPWHCLAIADTAAEVGANLEAGLNSEEVAKRQEQFGLNRLESKGGTHPIIRFLEQFNQPLLYILIIAGGIKFGLEGWQSANGWVIWAVVLINAIVSFIQETKAENAIAALSSSIETEATVYRNGEKNKVPSSEIVPGDIVFIASGDKIPADLRLVETKNLQVNESALTGESTAVEKRPDPVEENASLGDRKSMGYAGSFVTAGQGRGIVIATAKNTETGRISQLMENQNNLITPLTRKFSKFSRQLLYIILGVAALTLVVGLGYGQSLNEVFEATIALAVSAIPEGLPAVVTVALAIGVSRMANRHAIIRKLPAVETLGSATVICSDKTGTLTENQMTVQQIYVGGENYQVSGSGYTPEGEISSADQAINLADHPMLIECLQGGMLCNDSHLIQEENTWKIVGDPTEGALIVSARKAGFTLAELEAEMPRQDVIPFESEYQYMATLHESSDRQQLVIYVKGSVEAIVSRCDQMLDSDGQVIPVDAAEIHQQAETMAASGLRVLAIAKKPTQQTTLDHEDIAQGLEFLGLQGMIDPPRQEAIRAVAACKNAGIRVKMITGDHIITASAIASQMRLKRSGRVIAFTGEDLSQMDQQEFIKAAEDGVVFARVAPEQKLRLVEALQSRGDIVAMTGDGVNDAPALKQADIGVAMGQTGTEVAKEASDMVLTDDNFASIEAAVEEGRTVYRNLIKAIAFILPVNGGESMTIVISVLLNRLLPILSLQVLWLNMINSIAMTVPLAFEPKSKQVMEQPPLSPNRPLLNKPLLLRILLISVFNWVLIFGMFEWARMTTEEDAIARTMAIQALVFGRVFYLISLSQIGETISSKLRGKDTEIAEVPVIWIGIAVTMVLQVLFSQVGFMNTLFSTAPLDLQQWLTCFLAGLPMIIVAAIANRIDPPNQLAQN